MNDEKLNLLREALPYIQKFKGKTFVVKFSGKVTEDKENLASLAEELALLQQVGIRLCVVHGGGKQLTELAERLGVAQTVIDGRRVTSDETLELAKMIFAGKINTEFWRFCDSSVSKQLDFRALTATSCRRCAVRRK